MSSSIHIGNLPDKWKCLVPIAKAEGAVAIGMAQAAAVPDKTYQRFEKWVLSDASAEMAYLRKNLTERQNPKSPKILEQANAVISVAFPYGHIKGLPPIWNYISEHAKGRDYHKTLRNRLKRIAQGFSSIFPETVWRVFVDSAPVMERTWAVLCGIGAPGRNGMIIVPNIGSKVLIGEIILSLPGLHVPTTNTSTSTSFMFCDDCNKCLKACPTGALNNDGTINANRCLSYITIEKHSLTPPEGVLKSVEKIFGCDECVSVCPLNKPQKSVIETPAVTEIAPSLEKLAFMATDQLQQRLKGTCLYRTGAQQLQRIARQILKNQGT